MAIFSVIIPVWNGRDYLATCLSALFAQHLPPDHTVEVIAVDNASQDGSAEYIASEFPQVRLLRNRFNLGFSGGCNRGLRAAKGDVLVLLNQDTQVAHNWLSQLAENMHRPALGIAGCKILYPDGKTLQHAGGRIAWPLGFGDHDGKGELDHGQWDTTRQVEYVTGAAFAIRRTVYELIGELDEGFWPGYFEDTDYCLRARQAGFEIWYIPQATLNHQESASFARQDNFATTFHRNRLRFLLKHLPFEQWQEPFFAAESSRVTEPFSADGFELRQLYLEMLAIAPGLLRARQASPEDTEKVLHTIQRLIARTFLSPSQLDHSWRGQTAFFDLKPFQFSSSLPVIGAWLSGLRRLWYSVAARHGVEYLRLQQQEVNRQQAKFNQQFDEMFERQNAMLEQIKAQLFWQSQQNELLLRQVREMQSRVEQDR